MMLNSFCSMHHAVCSSFIAFFFSKDNYAWFMGMAILEQVILMKHEHVCLRWSLHISNSILKDNFYLAELSTGWLFNLALNA